MTIIKKLESLKLQLPTVSTPGGSYVSVNKRGNIAYVAIQFPIESGQYKYQGVLGEDIKTEEGYLAAQLCALNVLAQLESKVGFDAVVGLNHMDAYYRSIAGWDEAPEVVNGASDLFVNALGDRGTHTRAIFGVAHLPRKFCVGITCSFTIHV